MQVARMSRSRLGAGVVALLSALGCAQPSDSDAGEGTSATSGETATTETSGETGDGGEPLAVGCDLPVVHAADASAAAAGRAALIDAVLGGPLVPLQAMRNLSLVWGVGLIADDAAYWQQFRERYGLFEATWDNDGLPVGVQMHDPQFVTFNCLLCHAGAVDGELLLGLGNTQLDLQGLYDDLLALADIAGNFGIPVPALPWTLEQRTGAAGLTDAFGMGMQFATAGAPGGDELATRYGYQDPGAWWRVKFGERLYADGSGDALGHRTMMAMLLAFGLPFSDLLALDATIEDLRHFVLSIERPAWPGPALDDEARARGRVLFDERCADCHGVHSGTGAHHPSMVVELDVVGTDAERSVAFGPDEAAWINLSWFGEDYPMQDTDGYLAPPLAGIWASAPYLHNGSVPTLRALLVASERPVAWRQAARPDQVGSWDYDDVGLRWQAVDGPVNAGATIDQRRIHDARRPHLDNGGHDFAAGLDDAQIDDLLEYLKGL